MESAYSKKKCGNSEREGTVFNASLLWLLIFGSLVVQHICEIFLYPSNKSPCKFVLIVLLSIPVLEGEQTETIACAYPEVDLLRKEKTSPRFSTS